MSAIDNNTLPQYIPLEEVESLLRRSKRSLKREIKLLKRREEIERRYSDELTQWVVQTKEKVDFDRNYDHKDIRLCLMVSVREGEATALLHQQLADKLGQTDDAKGPISSLMGFKMKYFKKSGQDLEILTGRDRVSDYLDKYLKEYRSVTKECGESIKQAQQAAKSETRLEEQIQEQMGKMEVLARSNVRMTQYQIRTNKCKQNIRDLKSQLDVAHSKRENLVTKAISTVKKKAPVLKSIIDTLIELEEKRVTVLVNAISSSLDHFGILGPEAVAASKTARDLLAMMKSEVMVKEWREESTTSFKILGNSDKSSKEKDVKNVKSIDGLEERVLNSKPTPMHLFQASKETIKDDGETSNVNNANSGCEEGSKETLEKQEAAPKVKKPPRPKPFIRQSSLPSEKYELSEETNVVPPSTLFQAI